ncbi:MAG TPA: LamG-like jellyroll fold domain-containing protein [Candidatus Angelobacter sp.]|nr:LamG-like jellyroll fold domain-containing protein [Candidatus Angelobacter sp.]
MAALSLACAGQNAPVTQTQPPVSGTAILQTPASAHVFLIVLENGSYATVTNSTDPTHFMPNLIGLGNTYGHATNYVTNSGGSLLAYLWLSSGYCHSDPNSTADCPHPPFPAGVTGLHSFGCTGGACINPATQDFWPITDDNIYREMINHTPNPIPWKLYAESIPFAGYTGPRTNPPDPSAAYDPHHNGPLWYADVGRDPAQKQQQLNMVPFTQFTTDLQTSQLPQYTIILPNDDHDGHDGTPQVADQWLQTNVFGPLLSQPFFQPGGDGILIVTFDNQDDDGHGLVYWAVIGPGVKKGYVSNTAFHHEDTLLTILQALGIAARPGYTAIATGMGEFFGPSAPTAVLSASSIPFGNQTVGVPTTHSVTLSNTGNVPLNITAIAVTAGATDFSQTNDCGNSVAANAFCTVTVTFNPSVAGARAGTLTFTDSVTPAQTVSLSGTGVNPQLVVTRQGNGTGTVTSNVGGINCGATCSASLASGTTVTLTATPAAGSTFAGWSGACSGTLTCTVTMNGSQSVFATFNIIVPTFSLTVTRQGTGTGTVTSNVGGINCGTTCSAVYNSGSAVTLTATPAAGSIFAGWGGACSGTQTCAVTMNAALSVSATFTLQSGTNPPPARPLGAGIDPNNALAANLAGLFLMNEGSGSTDLNLVDSQTASFAGTALPTWNAADPSIVFGGGSSLNSYVNAGADLTFDKLPVSKITIVAKVFVNTVAPAGIVDKDDGNVDSGVLFGWDSTGALKLTVEKATTNMRVGTAAGVIASGQWMQVAFTWDGTVANASAAHLFLNGVEQTKTSSADGTGTLGYANATNQPFRIGTASFDTMAGSLNGKIAYLAVYKGRILSAIELNQLDSQLPITAGAITGTVTPNGPPTTITTASVGQTARLTFTGTTGQNASVQITGNTLGSVTVSLVAPSGATVSSATSSNASFTLPGQILTASGTYAVSIHPNSTTTGSIAVGVTLNNLPSRPATAALDTTNPLSTNLSGLFLMNEATGATDKNLVNAGLATFSGTGVPTWNTSDPSVVFKGGASLNSYLNAGTDLTFDQLTTNKMTVVARVFVTTVAAAGVCEKNDNNAGDSGFILGWDSTGSLKLTVEKSTTNMRVASASGTIVSGQWMQVAFTWDGTVGNASAAHLFLNGVEQTKSTSADGTGTLGFANATNQPFRIGNADFDPMAGSLNGKIGYLAVYKGRILTTSEMNQLDSQLPIH